MATPTPGNGAVITPNAILDLAVRTHDAVIRIEEKVTAIGGELAELRGRVRSLERWRLLQLASAAGGGGGMSLLVNALSHR